MEPLPVKNNYHLTDRKKFISQYLYCIVHLFYSSPLRLLHPINMHYQVLITDNSCMSNQQSMIIPIFNKYNHAMNGREEIRLISNKFHNIIKYYWDYIHLK